MENVKYVRDDGNWKRVIEKQDNAPEEYRTNYYYQHRQSMPELVIPQECAKKQKRREIPEEEQLSKRANIGALFCLLIILGLSGIAVLIIFISMRLNPNITIRSITESIVLWCAQTIGWAFSVFFNLCAKIFESALRVVPVL